MENTTFSQDLIQKLEKFHVLNHPYYQAWNEGSLSKESLQLYARQYFQHVDAFPRYVSAAHSQCSDWATRQILLENLIDEERGEKNHPELWMQFAEGLGQTRESVRAEKNLPETQDLIDSFFKNCRSGAPEALGALFAYEHQIPEVSRTKIKGLKNNYGIEDQRSIEFFEVHQKADEYHTDAVAQILNALSEDDQKKAEASSLEMAEKLWNFLSGICRESGVPMHCNAA
jgi:pyrroloquinoline-quinone synthase